MKTLLFELLEKKIEFKWRNHYCVDNNSRVHNTRLKAIKKYLSRNSNNLFMYYYAYKELLTFYLKFTFYRLAEQINF